MAKPMNATLIEGGHPVSGVIPPRIIERLSEFVSRIRARIRETQNEQSANYETQVFRFASDISTLGSKSRSPRPFSICAPP